MGWEASACRPGVARGQLCAVCGVWQEQPLVNVC